MMRLFRRARQFVAERPAFDWVVLGIGLVVFAILALWNITDASIWFDEAFSAYLTQFNLLDIARYTATDVHPPFYYWMLWLWEQLFGRTELAVRSMSVLFGATTIIFAFLLSRRLFGRRAAWLTVLFLVVSPMLLRYSQEARMYTLVSTIVLAATYVLTFATESKKRWLWVVYGILVGLGMWTHYFTALMWIAHWVWRGITVWQKGVRGQEFRRLFFTKGWMLAHVVAVAFFLPWLPVMAIQLGIIQGSGFWIGDVGIYTPANYVANLFYYLEQWQVLGWWALLLLVIVIGLVILGVRAYKRLGRKDRTKYLLIMSLALVPATILFVLSMPPLTSSFVERYLVPASVAFSIFVAVTIAVALRKSRLHVTLIAAALVVGAMVYGVSNVYTYGNYNKNSRTHIMTREVMEQVWEKAAPGEPIIANSSWIFFEAVFYKTDEHPVYFIDEGTKYEYGSQDVLKYNDLNKIKDLPEFLSQNDTIWYIGLAEEDDVPPYDATWQKLQTVVAHDPIDNKTVYRATQYRVN